MGGKKNRGNREQSPENNKKKGLMISEEHLMDKTHMDRTSYAPYLPKDSFYPPYPLTSQQLRKILADLNYLLYLDFKSFWATLLYNPTLNNYLGNSLSFFHRRWLNRYVYKESEPKSQYEIVKNEPGFIYTEQLFRITLTVYHRILHSAEESPQLSRIYNLRETIQNNYIFDVPKMLELIEIYGESNPQIVRIIVKNYVKLVPNFYSHVMNEMMPFLHKRIFSDIMELKVVTEREEFGVNYSYDRRKDDQLSPGEEELTRKTKIIMETLSYIQTLKAIINFFPVDCADNIYFNHEIHLIVENAYYELEAAYRVWNWQGQKQAMLPMINYILKFVKDYFIEYFTRMDHYLLKKDQKSRAIDAYLKAFERIIKDYGRRVSMGKKQKRKVLVLYGQIIKDWDLIDFLHRLYLSECEEPQYEINIDFLVDFKIELQNQFDPKAKEDQQEGRRIYNADIEEEPTIAGQLDQDSLEPEISQNEIDAIKKMQLKTSNDRQAQELERIIPKKKREQNYYDKLYSAYQSKININYDDEYDDLADYQKKPLFIDSQSSNSDSQEQLKHRPTNQSNPELFRKPSERGAKIPPKEQKPYYQTKGEDFKKQKLQQKQEQGQRDKQNNTKKDKPKFQQKKKYVAKNQFKVNSQNYDTSSYPQRSIKLDPMEDQPNCKVSIKYQEAEEAKKARAFNRQFEQEGQQSKNNEPNKPNKRKYNPQKDHNNGEPKGTNKNKNKYKQK